MSVSPADDDRPLVLAADDDPDILTLIGLTLKRAGYEVTTAADGAEAVARARERTPAIAVLDLSMPHMSGLEVTTALRAEPATKDIPIIILTAAVQAADIAAAREAGADAHVKKPFSPRELRARIAELLSSDGAGGADGGA